MNVTLQPNDIADVVAADRAHLWHHLIQHKPFETIDPRVIVEGRGNHDSYCSCSHGAGRVMSRGAAKRAFTVDDLIAQTAGIECRKDAAVIDEIPAAYKDIDAVMAAQADLVQVRHTLRQVLCIKG